jgi:hypothetical protein
MAHAEGSPSAQESIVFEQIIRSVYAFKAFSHCFAYKRKQRFWSDSSVGSLRTWSSIIFNALRFKFLSEKST